MAILKGIEVSIMSRGEKLTEYADPDSETESPDCVTRYIEAKTNENFEIDITAPSSEDDDRLEFDVDILADGNQVDGVLLIQDDLSDEAEGYHYRSDGYMCNWFEGSAARKYRFSAVNLGSSALPNLVSRRLENDGGKIVIRIHRILSLGPGQREKAPELTQPRRALKQGVTLDERVTKGRSLSHTTTLDKTDKTAVKVNNYKSYSPELEEAPFAVFTFCYLSKEGLKNERVIPRTPSSSLSPDSIAVSTLAPAIKPDPVVSVEATPVQPVTTVSSQRGRMTGLTVDELEVLLQHYRNQQATSQNNGLQRHAQNGPGEQSANRVVVKRERTSTLVLSDDDEVEIVEVKPAKRQKHAKAL